MKYIVVLGDGMADQPLEELGGKLLWNTQTPPGWIIWPDGEKWEW